MAYTGDPIEITGATCTIDAVEVALGGTVDATINTNATTEELLVWGSYPNPEVLGLNETASGTVNYIPTDTLAVIKGSVTPVALIISTTGFVFTGATTIIEAGSTALGPGAAKASFTFKASGVWTIAAT